jgi:hypothetical protein
MSGNGTKLTAFTIESLNAIDARLFEHADAITNAARRDVIADLRLALAPAISSPASGSRSPRSRRTPKTRILLASCVTR